VIKRPSADDLYRAIVEDMADGVYVVEPDRTIKSWNRGAEQISGYSAEKIVGRRCFDNILDHVDEQGRPLCHTVCPLAATMGDGEPREVIVWLRHRDGYRKPVHVRTSPLRDEAGDIVGGVEVFSDATASVEAAAQATRARQESLTDELTGLPNRRMFDSSLRGRIENLTRYGWRFGLLVVDVDHFKAVNDEHGHAFGDATLTGIAATLQGAVRSGDVVARWGGEEFSVLAEATDERALLETAERVRVLVERSEVRFEGVTLPIRVSVGGTLARPDDTPETLFERADRALYAAKTGGRNRTEIAA
jgi:diguanylate cyclase (GGDEF)-like protein/PAS domain S-box-containing protein